MDKLYIGIDIGKKDNVTAFTKENGKAARKNINIKNNYCGFQKLKEIIDILVFDLKLNGYDDVLVGIESTGHYWINLKIFLTRIGIRVVMVQGNSVKSMRDLIAPQTGKNDKIDSKAISLCIRDGYYIDIADKSIEASSLKNMARLRYDLLKSQTSIKNKIHVWIDINNIFYCNIFDNKLTRTGLILIEKYPLPKDVLKISTTNLINNLAKENPKLDRRQITLYKEEVEEWKEYIIESSEFLRSEIKTYIKNYRNIEREIKELEEEIEKLSIILYGKNYEALVKIKGMSNTNLSSFLSEIGDVRLFKTARQLQSYVGLSMKSYSSSTRMGESSITKKGNKRMRKNMYLITRSLIIHNEDVKKLYAYYLSKKRDNENKKIQMWVATMCKLLRCIYGSIKNNIEFDTRIVFENLDFSKCNMEKFNSIINNKNIEKVIDKNNERNRK
ncbi:IS110 family transposase [Eubacterium multiforme]|uniref:Transposase n=1 Tax=Eubacterium multiforme TaxID=83339 RepID=A0ABT9UTQ1_9FIRM|nr:IS110 family transposase [Eubacterium multiforme]MDQ0149671.1 transposase [Eubacterium multiforme]